MNTHVIVFRGINDRARDDFYDWKSSMKEESRYGRFEIISITPFSYYNPQMDDEHLTLTVVYEAVKKPNYEQRQFTQEELDAFPRG